MQARIKPYLTVFIQCSVGVVFLFSGLIKANDPLGFSYKMEEFFEAWGWFAMMPYALYCAFFMNMLEVFAGVALMVGWKPKPIVLLLIGLTVFFTFLTGYVLFSGKIRACGCFGDCIPLTPWQTFGKDLVLLSMLIFLLKNHQYIFSICDHFQQFTVILSSTLFALLFQVLVLRQLPTWDCLPYAVGNKILDQMKLPPSAVPDSVLYIFTYKKNDRIIEFDQNNFPADLDATYEFLERKEKIIYKGTGLPKIVDFSLQTLSNNDTTLAILAQEKPYILVWIKDFKPFNDFNYLDSIRCLATSQNTHYYIVTADKNFAVENAQKYPFLISDGTAIKTAARANPTFFMLQKDSIIAKATPQTWKNFKQIWDKH